MLISNASRCLRRVSTRVLKFALALVVLASVAACGAPEVRFTNPLIDADFPNVAVMPTADGWHYAYATQTITAAGKITNIQVARTRDLVHWEQLPDAMPVKPSWASRKQNFWSPHVIERRGTYYMYFNAEPNSPRPICLGVATAKQPEGPFTATDAPIQCGPEYEMIEPMAFDDTRTGKQLLYWGSGVDAIKVRELAADGLGFMPGSEPVALIGPPGDPADTVVLGAWVTVHDDAYYLYYATEDWTDESAPRFRIHVARSDSATGPYGSPEAPPTAPGRVLLEASERWQTIGLGATVRDDDGQDWLVYHTVDSSKPTLESSISGNLEDRRMVLMERLIYEDGWPRTASGKPSTAQQP